MASCRARRYRRWRDRRSRRSSCWKRVFGRLGLTARSYHRVLRVASTSADPQGSDVIGPTHIEEAVQLRRAADAFRPAPAP
jgi:magnesium chelatase family protein